MSEAALYDGQWLRTLVNANVIANLRKRLRGEEVFPLEKGKGSLPAALEKCVLDEGEACDVPSNYAALSFRWQKGQEIHRERLLASRLIREKILSQAARMT